MAVRTENIISLCSGVGGLELGLSFARPGLRTVCYVEREAYAAGILAARMADQALDEAPIWDDLTTFDGAAWRGRVSGIVGGFPCQPWSVAGKRLGTADERWLWHDIERIIDDVQPAWCFFENVPGLIRGGLPIVLAGLAARGFDAEWGVFSAAEVGAPHRRKRVYILAHARRGSDDADQRGREQRASGQGEASAGGVGSAVAHASSGGYGGRAEGSLREPIRGAAAEWVSRNVGHTASLRRGEGRPQHELWGGRDATAESGSQLGHANSPRLQGWGESEYGSPDERPTWPPGPTMADPASVQWDQEQRGSADGDAGRFPPGPDDMHGWSGVPEVLEPAVCRVANGFPHRVDRLRACGNGVVPLAAANAYRTLWGRLSTEPEPSRMTLHSTCKPGHTLVPISGDLWACECPAVYRRQGKGWVNPARLGLLDEVLSLTGGAAGLKSLAYAAEKVEQAKREAKNGKRVAA